EEFYPSHANHRSYCSDRSLQSAAAVEPTSPTRVEGRSVMDSIAGTPPRQLARIAGVLYLINIVLGAFAISIVPAIVVVAGDAAVTALRRQRKHTMNTAIETDAPDAGRPLMAGKTVLVTG